jgi:hypothetical protein
MIAHRDALLPWIGELKPNRFITFNFGYDVRQLDGERHIKHFCNRVMRDAYGRHWPELAGSKWLTLVGFWERLDANLNPHVHAMVRAPKAVAAVLRGPAPSYWKSAVPRGQLDIQELGSAPQRAARYITKQVWGKDGLDQLVIYAKSND